VVCANIRTSSKLHDGVMLDITSKIGVSLSDNGDIVAKPAVVLLFNVCYVKQDPALTPKSCSAKIEICHFSSGI
jgi:hypothetical protein